VKVNENSNRLWVVRFTGVEYVEMVQKSNRKWCGFRVGSREVVVGVLLLLVTAGGVYSGAGRQSEAKVLAVNEKRPLPRLLSLTMAAVESEESLDLLLDWFAESRVLEPLGRTTFFAGFIAMKRSSRSVLLLCGLCLSLAITCRLS